MTFVTPWFWYAGLAVAVGMFVAHLLITKQPRAAILPTIRFAPETVATTRTINRVPSDILLLAIRMLLAIAIGAALAHPIVKRAKDPLRRIIVLDQSRAVANIREAADSAQSFYRSDDLLVLFDSSAHLVTRGVPEVLATLKGTEHRGNLSGALIVALREASRIRESADSIELVVVSPFAREEIDDATMPIRNAWKARVRLASVTAQMDTTKAMVPGGVEVKARDDDPLTLVSRRPGEPPTARIVRGALTAADSEWAKSGKVLVHWPTSGAPAGFAARTPADTIGAVALGDESLVAIMERRTRGDSVKGWTVIGRWMDGDPAVLQAPLGNGCLRSVAVPLSSVGDFPLRVSVARFVDALTGPCRVRPNLTPADPSLKTMLAGAGPLATAAAIPSLETVRSPFATWLLALAILLAATELYVRRRTKVLSTGRET